MSPSGQIKLGAVWDMLDECAPGHTRIKQTHSWKIQFGERTYPSLPFGDRSVKRVRRRLIAKNHVKKMVRHLGLNTDCVEGLLPELGPVSKV